MLPCDVSLPITICEQVYMQINWFVTRSIGVHMAKYAVCQVILGDPNLMNTAEIKGFIHSAIRDLQEH